MGRAPKNAPSPDDSAGIGVLPDGSLDIVEEGAPPFKPKVKADLDLENLSVEELDEIIAANDA
jgi:hypothetical protein